MDIQVLERKYFWPSLYRDVYNYVDSCDICARFAKKTHKLREWKENPPQPRPFYSLSMDFVTMPTTERGMRFVLNINDDMTRFGAYFATRGQTAEEVAHHLYYGWFLKYGKCARLRCDSGPGFIGEVIESVLTAIASYVMASRRERTC